MNNASLYQANKRLLLTNHYIEPTRLFDRNKPDVDIIGGFLPAFSIGQGYSCSCILGLTSNIFYDARRYEWRPYDTSFTNVRNNGYSDSKLSFLKSEEGSKHGTMIQSIILTMILGECLDDDLKIFQTYDTTVTEHRFPEGTEHSRRKYVETIITNIIENHKSAMICEDDSLSDSFIEADYIDGVLKTQGYTLINRFRNNTVDCFRDLYGDKFILKISRGIYYFNGCGFLVIGRKAYNRELRQPDYWNFPRPASIACEKWFLNNLDYLKSMCRNAEIRSAIDHMIAGDDLSDLANKMTTKALKRIIQGKEKVSGRIDAQQQEKFLDETNIYNSVDEIDRNIKTFNTSTDAELKENSHKLNGLKAQASLLVQGMALENPEAQKAEALLKRLIAQNKLLDYEVDEHSSRLVLHTNWVPCDYVDIGNLNKRYLNSEIQNSYHSYYAQTDSYNESQIKERIKHRNELILSMINNENKYAFYVMPATILFHFGNVIDHGFTYECFKEYQKRDFLKNAHSVYFNGFIDSYHGYDVHRGCLGSSESLFNSKRSAYQLSALIVLCMQYLGTFITFDAGDRNLKDLPIINKETGEILSCPLMPDTEGKYINRNLSFQENVILDYPYFYPEDLKKGETNNGN